MKKYECGRQYTFNSMCRFDHILPMICLDKMDFSEQYHIKCQGLEVHTSTIPIPAKLINDSIFIENFLGRCQYIYR